MTVSPSLFLCFSYFYVMLKVHRQIPKKRISKSNVHVIKHANFQFYRVHPDGVISKT